MTYIKSMNKSNNLY